ncbi:MAG: ATP-binding cassette domain-containing protein [Planctomycetota bacterium]
MTTNAALLARSVEVSFDGHQVLRGVDVEIASGELVALVGPSGSGKTTLLRVLGGGLAPTAGTVEIDGTDPARCGARGLRPLRRRIGFVHQQLGLVPILRASHNVLVGRIGEHSLLGGLRSVFLPRDPEVLEVHRLLERVGIPEKLFERTDTLSGGQQQRVAIARALYQRPRILLADEPVASVDPARARAVVELLVELAREGGLTLVVSLHDLDLAREFFPRLVGLRDGRVAFDRATSEVDARSFEALYAFAGGDDLLRDGA